MSYSSQLEVTSNPDAALFHAFQVEPVFTGTSFGNPKGVEVIPDVVPESFLKGLADCDAGRVVDMEKAMQDPPPDQD
jgi:hypothetical protein